MTFRSKHLMLQQNFAKMTSINEIGDCNPRKRSLDSSSRNRDKQSIEGNVKLESLVSQVCPRKMHF